MSFMLSIIVFVYMPFASESDMRNIHNSESECIIKFFEVDVFALQQIL